MSAGPIKVLHVVLSLGPGGMENGVVNLANALPLAEFQTRICCLESAGELVKRLPGSAHVTVLNKPSGLSAKTAWRLARLLRQEPADILHTHNLGPLLYTVCARALGGGGLILHGEHGMITAAESSAFHLGLRRCLYRACRQVHTVSEGLRQYYLQRGFPPGKMVAVVNGVDTNRFVPGDPAAARRMLRLPETDLVVGMVASLQRRKRHQEMITAFEHCAERHPTARLLLVSSEGPESDRVRQQIAASPYAARIHWAGYQPDPRPYYQAMNLLTVPSVNEGLSNAALEAMASGVPVLAHSACGNPELITPEQDGFVADLATVDDLCKQLDRALSAPEQLAVMGRRARDKVVRNYSLTAMTARYVQLYRALAGRANPAGL